jgi:hypothetical protein
MASKRAKRLRRGDRIQVGSRVLTVTVDAFQPTSQAKGLVWVELSDGSAGAVEADQQFETA